MLGRQAEAERISEQGIGVDPLNSSLVANVASRLGRQGQFDRAEHLLLRLTQLPDMPVLIPYVITDLYQSWGRYVDALRWASYFDENNEQAAAVFFALGLNENAQAIMDTYAGASIFQRLVDLRPLLHLQGKHDEAVQLIYDYFEESGSSWADGYPDGVALGVTSLAMAGRHRSAIRLFDEFIADDIQRFETSAFGGSGWDACLSIVFAYQEVGETEKATRLLETLDRVAATDLRDPASWATLALRRSLAGDADGAYAALSKGVDLGWADYYAVVHDPRWARLLGDPSVQKLLERVHEKIANQRSIVEQQVAQRVVPE